MSSRLLHFLLFLFAGKPILLDLVIITHFKICMEQDFMMIMSSRLLHRLCLKWLLHKKYRFLKTKVGHKHWSRKWSYWKNDIEIFFLSELHQGWSINPLPHNAAFWHTEDIENIVRKGVIACNKQILFFSQCFLPYMALIFHFKYTLKCCLQFVSIWTSLKFCCMVMGWRSVVEPKVLQPRWTPLVFMPCLSLNDKPYYFSHFLLWCLQTFSMSVSV